MYAIVDLETTGGVSNKDKITEIAIYIHDGEKIVDELVTLLNPRRAIPPYVVKLTQITDRMVANAPLFEDMAPRIAKMMEGCIFVAHNSSFDYNFLKYEFQAIGHTFRKNSLCTLELSQRLMPGMTSYSLGRLCEQIGIQVENRHRAGGDAFATVKLFEKLLALKQHKVFEELLVIDTYSPQHHLSVSQKTIEAVPEVTGVYYFHDRDGKVIYLERGKNIRQRMMTHFSGRRDPRADQFRHLVADVSYEETGSELLSMLREADEIRNLKPTFNRAHKGANFRFGIFHHYTPDGYLQFRLEALTPENEVHSVAQYFTFRQGERMLETAVKRYSLCSFHAGLDTDGQAGQPCSRKRKGQCLGACVSREAPDTYNSRAQAADALLQLEAESFFLIDKGRHWEERTVFQVEKGRLIGVGYITAEESFYKPKDLAKAIKPIAEKPETRKLIGGFIRKKKMEKLIPY